MGFNSDSAAPHRARTAVQQLHELGIEPPPAVAAALATLDRIEAATPQAPPTSAIADAVLDDDQDAIDDAIIAELAAPLIRAGHAQARQRAGHAVMAAITGPAAKTIHTALSALAAGHIKRLEKAAAITAPIEKLVRDGRHEEAGIVATASVDEAALDALHRWRDRHLGGNHRPVPDVSRFREPDFANHGALEGIRAGGTAWYPSPREASALAAQLTARRGADEQAVLAGTATR